jgi:hypothetical protein
MPSARRNCVLIINELISLAVAVLMQVLCADIIGSWHPKKRSVEVQCGEIKTVLFGYLHQKLDWGDTESADILRLQSSCM